MTAQVVQVFLTIGAGADRNCLTPDLWMKKAPECSSVDNSTRTRVRFKSLVGVSRPQRSEAGNSSASQTARQMRLHGTPAASASETVIPSNPAKLYIRAHVGA